MDKAKKRQYDHLHYQEIKEKRNGYDCQYRLEHKQERREYEKRYYLDLKILVFSHYSDGIPKCVKCGIDDMDILTIDHIEGGGYKERQGGISRGGYSFYQRLKKLGYPKGYQVLCANCNLKKLIEEGK